MAEEYVVQMKGITKVYPNGIAANQDERARSTR